MKFSRQIFEATASSNKQPLFFLLSTNFATNYKNYTQLDKIKYIKFLNIGRCN